MKFAKYIKEHPLPPLTEEQTKEGAAQKELNKWVSNRLYTAEVADNILNVTVYRKEKSVLIPLYRHLYDGKSYATLRYSDNKKLSGTIVTYLSVSSSTPLDTGSEKAFRDFFHEQNADINALVRAEQKILDKKREQAHQKIKDKIDARMTSIKAPSAKLSEWIRDKAFASSRYFFYNYRKGSVQQGYCSHCKKEFSAEGVKMNKTIPCSRCGSELICKPIGRVSKYPIGHYLNIDYADTAMDGDEEAIVIRTFYARLTVSGHRDGASFCHEKIAITETTRSFHDKESFDFRDGDDENHFFVYSSFMGEPGKHWCTLRTCQNIMGDYAKRVIYPDSLANLKSIPWLKNIELSAVSKYTDCIGSLVEQLKRYPVIENFVKQGKIRIATKLLNSKSWEQDSRFTDLCNIGERSPMKFLGVDRITFAQLGDISTKDFVLYSIFGDVSMYKRACELELTNVVSTLGMVVRDTGLKPARIIGYLEKQVKNSQKKGYELLSVYNDYHSMVKDLKFKRTDSVDYPKDLDKEHDRLMKLKTDKIYVKQNPKLKKRGELLHKLDWNDGTYLIRAFDDASDFLTESAVLGHCVKTYIDRCAKGETNIYGIRMVDRPDVPFYTLTLSNSCKVTQNLGKSNCMPTKEIRDFVEKWKKRVLEKNREDFIKEARKTA